jgi:hypothetical protein
MRRLLSASSCCAPVSDPGLVASTIALTFGIAKADETLPLEVMK